MGVFKTALRAVEAIVEKKLSEKANISWKEFTVTDKEGDKTVMLVYWVDERVEAEVCFAPDGWGPYETSSVEAKTLDFKDTYNQLRGERFQNGQETNAYKVYKDKSARRSFSTCWRSTE